VEPGPTEQTRARLEESLRGLDDTLSTLGELGQGSDPAERQPAQSDPNDIASNLTDLERREATLDHARSQREEVLAALGRLDDGSYGRCVDCGSPLPEERLQARPEAARCLQDQVRLERAS
jgi:DnaK suppressor protein